MPYASEVRLIKGRLKFGHAELSAPFPSAVVIYKPERTPAFGMFDAN